MNPVLTYYRKLEATHASGAATEHSYRSALQELLQALDSNIEVINEPKQAEFGAPDLSCNGMACRSATSNAKTCTLTST